MIWTKSFWKGAAERSIKTGAQTLAAYFVIGTTGILDFGWAAALSITGAAVVASVLTSIGNADFVAGPTKKPSVVVNNFSNTPSNISGTVNLSGTHRFTDGKHEAGN